MKFVKAFAALGYDLTFPQVWSAANSRGVCLALWEIEIRRAKGAIWMDTKVCCGPNDLWRDNRNNKRRIKHLQLASQNFAGFFDVILLSGEPSKKRYKSAQPWSGTGYPGRWCIESESIEADTGHFRAHVAHLSSA